MSIKFSAKNVKFNESLKGFANKRLKTIEKISGDIIEAEIIASEEKIDFRVELFLKTRLHSYHIDENDPILKQALRNTLNTLRIQAKKNKEKIKLEKKRKNLKAKHQKMIADEILEPAQPETENKIIVNNLAGALIKEGSRLKDEGDITGAVARYKEVINNEEMSEEIAF